jgi:lysophospholipase L1-like esterase
MSTKRFMAAVGALLSLVLAPAASADRGVDYYVSLGDSLAAGSQPAIVSDSDQTNEGYADQLYAILHARQPSLRLLKLGCGGESTTSMISGLSAAPAPTCDPRVYKSRYPHGGTQLKEALSFLHAHRQFVELVTIDIGANDVIFGGGVPAIEANLPVILAALRNAVGPGVPIVGMTYHDPFLAFVWFTSFDLGALQAEANSHLANGTLEHIYGSFNDPGRRGRSSLFKQRHDDPAERAAARCASHLRVDLDLRRRRKLRVELRMLRSPSERDRLRGHCAGVRGGYAVRAPPHAGRRLGRLVAQESVATLLASDGQVTPDPGGSAASFRDPVRGCTLMLVTPTGIELAAWCQPLPSFAILTHRGRNTGRTYRTPITSSSEATSTSFS